MLHIQRPHTDPYFNLAAEEYLLRTVEEDCFMLWVNEPSVVVGKHQNAFAEVDRQYVKAKNIPVIRRITGGGTVFHDPGNLNFSFISEGEKDKLVDFRRFTQPVIDYLQGRGLSARFEGKNDIRIDGLKVSGNAEHVYRNKVLHHGTLLFSSQLQNLNRAIRGQEALFRDKAVRSVRSKVANIADLLSEPITLDEFREGIVDHLKANNRNFQSVSLSRTDEQAIRQLADKKYRTWEWNFGYSPTFVFEKIIHFRDQKIEVRMEVKNGIIHESVARSVEGDQLPFGSLNGLRFEEDHLLEHYLKSDFSSILSPESYAELLTMLLY
jgi:lipoate-protein ligase A